MTPKIVLLGLLASVSILVPGSLGKPPGQSTTNYNTQQSANQGSQIQIQASSQQGNQQASGIQISSSGAGTYYQIQRPNAIPIIQYIPPSQGNIGAQIPIGYPINGGIQAIPGNVQIVGLPQIQQQLQQLQQLQQSGNGAIYVLVNNPQSQQTPINAGVQLIPVGFPGIRPIPQPQYVQVQIPQGQVQVQQEASAQAPQILYQQQVQQPQYQQQVQQPQVQSQIQIQGSSETYKPQQPQQPLYIPVTQKPQVQVQVQTSGTYKKPQNTYQQSLPTERPQPTYQQQTQKPQNTYVQPTQKPQNTYVQPTQKPQAIYTQSGSAASDEFPSLDLQLTDSQNEGPQPSGSINF